jgi:hypothetical protein
MGVITSLFARKMVAAAGPDVDGGAFLKVAGLDPSAPWDPKLMILDTAYYEMLERMAEVMDVTALPVKTGASMRCDDYGALGLAWKAAPTLRGSYARVERFAQLWTSVVEYELRPSDAGLLFVLHRSGPRRLGLRLSNEATLASAVAISREVCPVPFHPIRVFFKHPAPSTLMHHEAYFGCPVEFGAADDALLLSPDALAQANKPKDAIAQALSEGAPKMADIAPRLGLSARSLPPAACPSTV